ncbi:hypothetical protein GF323_05825 [Candidatus Woesearchaeota archaeon]|nr:hypothetical protein [Candidatus Woesearchaeota archaeon]
MPIMYGAAGSIVNRLTSLEYNTMKYAAAGVVHVGLEALLSDIKMRIEIRKHRRLIDIVEDMSAEETQLLVGGLAYRWFGSDIS